MKPAPGTVPAHTAWLARALLWVLPLLWSSNYLIARAADGVIAPHALAFGRWALACALMAPFLGAGLWRQRAAVAREWRHLFVLGALGMWICGAFVYLGGQTTSSTNIALIYAATPIAIVAAGARVLDEHMAPAQWGGVVLALLGVLFVIAKGDLEHLLQVRFTPGDGWIVGAAVSWAAYSVLLKRWTSALGPAERLLAMALGGLLLLGPLTVLEAWHTPMPPVGAQAMTLIALAAVLPGVLSYTAYAYMQRELGAARTALVMYLSPLYAALGAWWLLGEPPAWYHAVGAALILPSIALATRQAPARLVEAGS